MIHGLYLEWGWEWVEVMKGINEDTSPSRLDTTWQGPWSSHSPLHKQIPLIYVKSKGCKKLKQGKGIENVSGCFFVGWSGKDSLIRRHVSRDMKEVSQADNYGKSIPGRGNRQCKGPEAGTCLTCLKKLKKASGAGVKWEVMGVELYGFSNLDFLCVCVFFFSNEKNCEIYNNIEFNILILFNRTV